MISEQIINQINLLAKKYPKDNKKSVVMEALKMVQNENSGHLTLELIKELAEYLNLPAIVVQEVAYFYSMYEHKPVGKHKICICHNISCMLNGSDDLIKYLQSKLDIKTGEVTKDGKFSIKKVECLGACVGAPMMQIGDTYYENLTKDKIDMILDGF